MAGNRLSIRWTGGMYGYTVSIPDYEGGDVVKAEAVDAALTLLESLRRPHLVIEEDCWYSCPKSGECCDPDADKTKCNCGADAANDKLDEILGLLE